jgi:hypothetical protein
MNSKLAEVAERLVLSFRRIALGNGQIAFAAEELRSFGNSDALFLLWNLPAL